VGGHGVVIVAVGNADVDVLYTSPFWLLVAGASTGTGGTTGEYGTCTSLSGDPLREGFVEGFVDGMLVLPFHCTSEWNISTATTSYLVS